MLCIHEYVDIASTHSTLLPSAERLYTVTSEGQVLSVVHS